MQYQEHRMQVIIFCSPLFLGLSLLPHGLQQHRSEVQVNRKARGASIILIFVLALFLWNRITININCIFIVAGYMQKQFLMTTDKRKYFIFSIAELLRKAVKGAFKKRSLAHGRRNCLFYHFCFTTHTGNIHTTFQTGFGTTIDKS